MTSPIKPRRTCNIYTANRHAMETPRVSAMRAIVWPDIQVIANPVLQEKLGGSKRVSHLFDENLWASSPPTRVGCGRAVMWSLTEKEWRKIAERWHRDHKHKHGAKAREKQQELAKERPKSLTHTPFADALSSLKGEKT